MYNKKWFKVLVWIAASFFFFLNACVLICTLGPPPTETQVQLWMAGMMQAMHSSLMAFSMQLEEGGQLASIIYQSSQIIAPFALGGFFLGLLFRSGNQHGKKTR